LLGVVTGPRKAPCPAGAAGVRRFAWATAALLYHELGLAATLALVAWLGRGAPNRVGLGTFGVLWVMRLSAKFNVFLGVRNLTEGFVPHGLRYLLSYGRRARWNPLMPASLAGGAAAAAWLGGEALAEGASSFVVVSRTLVTTLLSLAVLEHIFLALPLPDALLWRWAVPNPTAKPVRGMRVEVR
jgi:putative photosynthetic complex assembly protein 2